MDTLLKHCALLCISWIVIATAQAAGTLDYQVITERTHKPVLFTQGLLVDGEHFYESSGLYEKSLLVSYPVAEPASTWAKISAPFTKKNTIPARYFAEGLALHNKQLFLLTWQEGTVFVYDQHTFALLKIMSYRGEGWGLASDGKQLIRSDGSDTLSFHNPDDFALIKTLQVTDNNSPINRINELEFFGGFIWANIWYDDRIIKIDPHTGKVVAQLDLKKIKQQMKLTSDDQVANGIAWDEQRQGMWVTGKNWPAMFLLKIANK